MKRSYAGRSRPLLILLAVLGLSGCASTCEFENTLLFMKRNEFQEICMVMNEPAELAGQEYCMRKREPVGTDLRAAGVPK